MTVPPPYTLKANVAITAIILNVFFVALRTWARSLQRLRWLWADILVPLSAMFNIVNCIFIIVVEIRIGNPKGSHKTNPQIQKFNAFWIPMIHGLQTALPKLAVLDIYLYIFPEKWSRWTLMATAVVVAANGLVYIPTTIWQCNPINAAWDYSIKGATCNNVKLHYSFLGLPHILTDLVMLIVPIPIIARLQMDRTIKAGVMATFLSGSIGLVASIIRFSFFLQWTPATNRNTEIAISSTVEALSYLIAACILSMRPLVVVFLKRASKLVSPRNTSGVSRLTGKDKSTSKRLGSLDKGSSTGELVSTVDGVHELHEVVVKIDDASMRRSQSSRVSVLPKGIEEPRNERY